MNLLATSAQVLFIPVGSLSIGQLRIDVGIAAGFIKNRRQFPGEMTAIAYFI